LISLFYLFLNCIRPLSQNSCSLQTSRPNYFKIHFQQKYQNCSRTYHFPIKRSCHWLANVTAGIRLIPNFGCIERHLLNHISDQSLAQNLLYIIIHILYSICYHYHRFGPIAFPFPLIFHLPSPSFISVSSFTTIRTCPGMQFDSMGVCLHLATSWSPAQGVLPNV
jgi:hypothetical protein